MTGLDQVPQRHGDARQLSSPRIIGQQEGIAADQRLRSLQLVGQEPFRRGTQLLLVRQVGKMERGPEGIKNIPLRWIDEQMLAPQPGSPVPFGPELTPFPNRDGCDFNLGDRGRPSFDGRGTQAPRGELDNGAVHEVQLQRSNGMARPQREWNEVVQGLNGYGSEGDILGGGQLRSARP